MPVLRKLRAVDASSPDCPRIAPSTRAAAGHTWWRATHPEVPCPSDPSSASSSRSPPWKGAGVQLRRAFGFGDPSEFDPFLLLDDFRNDRPEDYAAGFPWHPHRGIETITYVLAGTVEHGDSLGNRGSLGAGDVQWMTAGSGILHQEMPQGDPAGPDARLPALGQPARVAQDDGAALPGRRRAPTIPEVIDDDGTRVRIICGEFWGKRGPVDGIAADPRYLDVSVPPGQAQDAAGRDRRATPSPTSSTAPARFADASAPHGVLTEQEIDGREILIRERTGNRSLVLFDRGDEVTVQAGEEGIRFLLVSGKPIRGAGRLVRPDRDEHPGRAAAGVARAAERDVHPPELTSAWRRTATSRAGS